MRWQRTHDIIITVHVIAIVVVAVVILNAPFSLILFLCVRAGESAASVNRVPLKREDKARILRVVTLFFVFLTPKTKQEDENVIIIRRLKQNNHDHFFFPDRLMGQEKIYEISL